MPVSTRLTSDELQKVIQGFSGRWKRYRSPYGVVRAAEAHDEFEIICREGVLKGDEGDFVCVAEDTYDCWVDEAFNFRRMHVEIVGAGSGEPS
jgi:hypothetical protein